MNNNNNNSKDKLVNELNDFMDKYKISEIDFGKHKLKKHKNGKDNNSERRM